MRILKSSFLGKVLHSCAKALYSLTKKIWKILILCNYCGRDCGFDSVVSEYGFTCWDCLERLQKRDRRNNG